MTETVATDQTLVLDGATLIKAFNLLGDALPEGQWRSYSPEQQRFLDLARTYGSVVQGLNGLPTEISHSDGPLNAFLEKHGFPPLFRPFTNGVGVAAVLDMLVEWAYGAVPTTIRCQDGVTGVKRYPAIRFDCGFQCYSVPGHNRPLVRLSTKDGSAVWLLMVESRPASGLELFETVFKAANSHSDAYDQVYSSLRVPMLDVRATTELNWLLGLSKGTYGISQATQAFRLRLNEQGARAQVATALVARECVSLGAELVLDGPFVGWFTQSHSSFPVASFYAGYDCWREPQGGLLG